MTPDAHTLRMRPVWRCLAVAQALKIEATVREHIHSRRLHGRAWMMSRVILAPKGRNPEELYILAHECAHLVLNHLNTTKPKHRIEFEAERWAHEAMARHNVELSERTTRNAKAYVRGIIAKDRKAGLEIDPEAEQWSGR